MTRDLPSHWVICFLNKALDVANSHALRYRLQAPLRNGVIPRRPIYYASLSDDARAPKPLGDLFLKRGAGRCPFLTLFLDLLYLLRTVFLDLYCLISAFELQESVGNAFLDMS